MQQKQMGFVRFYYDSKQAFFLLTNLDIMQLLTKCQVLSKHIHFRN